jgi:GntR family transcriptional regulator/MocR family aminotransferase
MEDVVRAQTMSLRAVEMTTQLTLARYIRSHGYDQRVRGVRLAYEARYRHLVDAVERLSRAVPGVRLGGISAGGQAPLLLPADGAGEEVVIRAAAAEGIGLEGLSPSSHHPSEHPPGLLLGFSRPPDYLYPAALETLGRVLAESWHR